MRDEVQSRIEMADVDLAQEIVDRLNRLLMDPGVPEALATVMRSRISVDMAVVDHPTLQLDVDESCAYLGWLGILNGIVGAIPDGKMAGWGYVCAVLEDDGGPVLRFERTGRG